ncbi:MAG: hypothetical protein AMXMBFR56_65780 [Polyangiaceae bacterium]
MFMATRKRGQGSKWCRPSTRLAIYHRDGFCCVYCGRGAEEGVQLTLDHIVACELGGTNEASNLVTACLSCNSAKQHKTMRAWFQALRDQGVNTNGLALRVRRHAARKLNREAGRALLTERTQQAA